LAPVSAIIAPTVHTYTELRFSENQFETRLDGSYQPEGRELSETRKLAAVLVADVVGYSRLAGAGEDIEPSRVFVGFVAISSARKSLPIADGSSSAPATEALSSSAAWSAE
jgi:hypothetical protein